MHSGEHIGEEKGMDGYIDRHGHLGMRLVMYSSKEKVLLWL